jgi:hypothetical protein
VYGVLFLVFGVLCLVFEMRVVSCAPVECSLAASLMGIKIRYSDWCFVFGVYNASCGVRVTSCGIRVAGEAFHAGLKLKTE